MTVKYIIPSLLKNWEKKKVSRIIKLTICNIVWRALRPFPFPLKGLSIGENTYPHTWGNQTLRWSEYSQGTFIKYDIKYLLSNIFSCFWKNIIALSTSNEFNPPWKSAGSNLVPDALSLLYRILWRLFVIMASHQMLFLSSNHILKKFFPSQF